MNVAVVASLLVLALLLLLGLAVLTATRPEAAIPGVEEHLRRWSALHAGIDPYGNRAVEWWLRLMHALGRPLGRWGVQPDVITVGGLWWAVLSAVLAGGSGRWPMIAAVALIVGAVADGLDGTVAVLTDRATRWGGVLDAMIDRLADLVYLGALVVLGASPGAAVAAGVLLFGLEYLRARAGEQGARITTVTVGERPTRLVLVGLGLWCAGLFHPHAAVIASGAASAVAVVGGIGLAQLVPAVRRDLR